MATRSSKDMGFRMDTAGGVLADISGQINQQTLRRATTMLDDTGMGDTQHAMLPGLQAADRIPLNGRVNSTVENLFGPAMGISTTRTVEFKAYTGRYYTGEVYVESYEVSGNVDTLQTFSVELVTATGLSRTSVALA